jgi:beta-lactamase regulating signal transducer with metallopeptidase domain
MTLLISWLSPATLRLLALALLHFLWQGAALAALGYVAMLLCRSAATRYVVGVSTLALMMAAPVGTFWWLRLVEQRASDVIMRNPASEPTSSYSTALFIPVNNDVPGRPESAPHYFLWLVEVWFAGVVLLSLRSAGGILLVERLRRKETVPLAKELLDMCVALQQRMGLKRAVQYCESLHLDAPAVAGWIRPVVLLPVSALAGLTEAQLEAVIAHELVHIRRYDVFINLFQVAVETLLFYHPAVWWIGKRVRTEREHCCDDAAVAMCGNAVTYAYALTHLAESKAAPELAMAANRSPLVRRIARLLGANNAAESVRGATLSAGVLCLSAALLAGGALLGSVRYVHAQTPVAAPTPAAKSASPKHAMVAAAVSEAPVAQPRVPTSTVEPAPEATPRFEAENPAPVANPAAQGEPAAAPQVGSEIAKSSYIDSLKDAGLTDLTVDQLIALKVQGITAEYVRSMKEYVQSKNGKLDVETLIGMKVQGITGDYVKAMRAAVGEDLDGGELIGLKVQGVTPDYVRQVHDMGFKVDAGDIIGMKVQGVTPEYVKEMRDLGLKLDSGDLIGMKVQGINPEYVRQIRALGLNSDPGDLIGMKVQGVSPEYVKGFTDLGMHPSTGELIGMKVQGVTPNYFKEMQAAGFKMDVDEAIGAKIQGITPEFIAKVRSHGFQDLTLDKLIALKRTGVLDAEK